MDHDLDVEKAEAETGLTAWVSSRVKLASQILRVESDPDKRSNQILTLASDKKRVVTAEWFNKHNVHVGGYFIVYPDDGYESFCPADVFERHHEPHSIAFADDDLPPISAYATGSELER